ncbi:quinone-dependent dihydroorotate dehydrogenase [Rathayibacter toxicus]|uniref:Dihydroorotate dehydrogenase (quinone) n=1 Tax=Rathayibacter toxicus TaxID=145458 RepID=A0A0C5BH12_9MICO|nr:quinone-dependent dihydroorotate dehydrogenase [Rathayibacter toxicus]AJM77485.1 diguanylate cyclase [Rathayibacter toxicus]ALS56605.1 dihydroorotate dehydrogenase 2 [Rathayibacter toxicus]KKM44697.1 diguanylate cyclase [Rathayibacter toxicus]PPG21566.1 quinone-dependent dihydroorotate dehydrogenase [Rathayibacter toxicus]PPG46530.1 quinone-dependent dihydroorotate dehydrogenase [Rathayibacter toxicus]
MYSFIFRTVLRRLDPERAHHLAFPVLRALGVIAPAVRRFTAPRTDLSVDTLGLHFATPFGMAAGFDKDATAVLGLGALGFGHVEVGTVTALPQPGNDRPRLFRLIADRAVINRMGFNNHGARKTARRLARLRSVPGRPIIGVNIGKSRVVTVDDAVEDYLISTRLLAPLADYLVVNVSSPNTPGLRGLQAIDRLEPLLVAVKGAANSTPLLVKIAPDLSDDEVHRVAALSVRLGLSGIVATNTTLSRDGLRTEPEAIDDIGAGGLSGAPLAARSLAVLRLIRAVVPASFCIISVGGVETAADVRERLDAGATLVQGYTAFIYRGPLWACAVNRGLRS